MLDIKKIARIIVLSLLFLNFAVSTLHAAHSFRCGGDLVSIGEYSFKVLTSCGEPISKEVIGYTLKNNERELKLEVWVYGPKGGLYYFLKFEGGKLVKITNAKE